MYQLPAITPFLIIFSTIIVLLLIISFYRNHKLIAYLSLIGFILTSISFIYISDKLPQWTNNMIFINSFSSFYIRLILFAAILINILSIGYFEKVEEQKEEYYLFLQVAVLGTITMISSIHFAVFFIGLELLSIPLYVMIGYIRKNPSSIEASIKYLILAAASSSILLFGIALIYLVTGTMNIYKVVFILNSMQHLSVLCIVGMAMIISAIGFKLSLSPFHMWTPDVYQGAPAPVTAFLATISKGGVFVLLINLFANINLQSGKTIVIALIVLSSLSMFIGNLLALRQNSIKRLLACSSIAHMGYLLIPIIIGGVTGVRAAMFYLSMYFIATVGIFSVIAILSKEGNEIKNIEDFKGLYLRNKWLAIVFATMIFSLAGMPLTAGFFSKFYILFVGALNAQWLLIWFLIINSAIGLYYYLKIVFFIFKPISENQNKEIVLIPVGSSIALAISLMIIIWIGIAPNELINLIHIVYK
jgi:NADH-quinone oxidoreductase subunit N